MQPTISSYHPLRNLQRQFSQLHDMFSVLRILQSASQDSEFTEISMAANDKFQYPTSPTNDKLRPKKRR